MSFSNFTFSQAKQVFNLKVIENSRVIPDRLVELATSSWLTETLDRNLALAIAIGTEKARSELIITPILVEIRQRLKQEIALFSGTEFNVDNSRGLNGVCDYIISKSPEQLVVEAPLLMLVEAKKADLNTGMGQVTAEMVAAQIFNQQEAKRRNNTLTSGKIYGCVTSGTQWRFLCLKDKNLTVQLEDISLKPIEHLLGILLWICTQTD